MILSYTESIERVEAELRDIRRKLSHLLVAAKPLDDFGLRIECLVPRVVEV